MNVLPHIVTLKIFLLRNKTVLEKKRSCIEHLYVLDSIIHYSFAKDKEIYACFIHMAKAFDSVNRDLLGSKLISYNLGIRLFNAYISMYENNVTKILIYDKCTEWFPIKVGVRQGDNLSPILFNLFLNQLATDIKNANLGVDVKGKNIEILLYADDIVLFTDKCVNLQKMIDIVYTSCSKWRLKVNINKTKILHFRKP